jgi:hypothetical protein
MECPEPVVKVLRRDILTQFSALDVTTPLVAGEIGAGANRV